MQGKVFVGAAAGLCFASAIGLGPAPAAAQDKTWAGPYVGVLLGKGWANIDGPASTGLGYTFGIFGGYNFEIAGRFLAGLDADLTLSGRGTEVYDNPWTSNFRLRFGGAWDSVFIYGAAGASLARVGIEGTFSTEFGMNIGAGAELHVGPAIGRVEYLYSRFGEVRGTGQTAALHEVRLGVGITF